MFSIWFFLVVSMFLARFPICVFTEALISLNFLDIFSFHYLDTLITATLNYVTAKSNIRAHQSQFLLSFFYLEYKLLLVISYFYNYNWAIISCLFACLVIWGENWILQIICCRNIETTRTKWKFTFCYVLTICCWCCYRRTFGMGGVGSKCKFHISWNMYATVDTPAYVFWLPTAAFSVQPQSISHAFTQFSHLSKIWTDLGAHLLYSSFTSGTFLLNFQLFSIAKPCLVTRQLSSQVGCGLRNALRQKKQQICKPFPSVFLSFKGRLLTGFCQLVLLGPPESPLCMCNLVVIQGFGLSLCPYFGFTPYTTLSLPRFPGSYISSSFTSPELCPLLF